MNKYILKSSALFTAAMLMGSLFTSCSDDESLIPEFAIEEIDLSSYEVTTDCNGFGIGTAGYLDRGTANKYIVRSNTSWQLVPQGDEDASWVVLHAAKGDKDGIFYLAVKENTSYYSRSANLAIKVNGSTEEPQIIHVTQTGAEPSLFVTESTVLRGSGGNVTLSVSANLNWTCELDKSCTWLTVDSINASQIMMSAQLNDTEEIRSTTLAVMSPERPELDRTVHITQYGESLIYYDDFEYLGGSNLTSWSDSNTQTNMIKWTDDQLSNGWSCWHDTYFDSDALGNELSTIAALVYRCSYDGNSMMKLGKTSWCGTAVSPAFTSLADGETVDVTVSFCACPFRSAGSATTNPGKLDRSNIMVGVYGPGEVQDANDIMKDINVKYVVSAETIENSKLVYASALAAAKKDMSGTYPVVKFELENYPPGKLEDFNYYPKPIDSSVAMHTVTIKGVTNQTHLVFFGGGYDYFNEDDDTTTKVTGKSGKTYTATIVNKANRIFLDNVMVNIVK